MALALGMNSKNGCPGGERYDLYLKHSREADNMTVVYISLMNTPACPPFG